MKILYVNHELYKSFKMNYYSTCYDCNDYAILIYQGRTEINFNLLDLFSIVVQDKKTNDYLKVTEEQVTPMFFNLEDAQQYSISVIKNVKRNFTKYNQILKQKIIEGDINNSLKITDWIDMLNNNR